MPHSKFVNRKTLVSITVAMATAALAGTAGANDARTSIPADMAAAMQRDLNLTAEQLPRFFKLQHETLAREAQARRAFGANFAGGWLERTTAGDFRYVVATAGAAKASLPGSEVRQVRHSLHKLEGTMAPPVDYVWVAAGSQARNEQTAKSDQDNCLVLDNRYDPAQHGAYFKELARFVCDGLDACGYIYCPGEMMAMTDQWRQPQRVWADYFARWTSTPDPKALMLTCVFFDLRAVHGQSALLDDLRRDVLQRTQGNSLFLAHMVGNALQHQPPLGLFKGIATIRSGEHKGTVDLKHTGVVPIVDLARVYALAGGDNAVNTHDRLVGAAAGGAISEQSARDLRDALEFLAFTRIQHQARQITAGDKPDNYLRLDDLSNFERTQLKDAFTVVQSLQNVLSHRYRM